MSDDSKKTAGSQVPEETAARDEELVTCYVSKRMVPRSQTVEVTYAPGKVHFILPQYVRF